MNMLAVPWVEPVDVANASLFLASDEARYITAVTLPVDAGARSAEELRRRVRNASTVLSNASLASIIAQCPQLGNTWSSALGMVRIGISAMSSGLTRSSRPHVSSVGAATLCITAHGIGGSAGTHRRHHLRERRLAVHAPR